MELIYRVIGENIIQLLHCYKIIKIVVSIIIIDILKVVLRVILQLNIYFMKLAIY